MLRSFGSSCKQDLRKTAVAVSTRYAHLRASFIFPLQQSIRCSTAAARFSFRHVRNAGYTIENPPLKAKSIETKRQEVQKRRIQLPEVLSMTNGLFSRNLTKDPVLVCLRAIQESSLLSEYFGNSDKARMLAEAMVLTEYPHRAYRVLLLAHRFGCKLKQNAYECVARLYAEANQWYLIPPLVSLGRKQEGRSTVRLLNWRARAFVERNHYGLLDDVLADFERENLRPNRRTFHILVSGQIRNRNLQQAKHYLREMEGAGLPIDATTHGLVLSAYRALGPNADVQSQAFEALRDVGTHTATSILNSLMRIHLDAGDMLGALRVLALFDQHLVDSDLAEVPWAGSSRHVGDYPSCGIEEYCLSSHTPMYSIAQKPVPDVTTFTMLINYMATRRDLPRALRIVGRMMTAGIQPNAGTAAAVVRAHFSAGDEITAVHLIATMCDPEKVPLSLFSPLAPSSSFPEHHHLLPLRIPLSIEVCNTFLNGVLCTRGLNGALVVLRIMRASRISPNADTVEQVMHHLEKVEHVRPRELIRILRHLTSSTNPPTLRHLHIILKSILRRQKYLLNGAGWNVTAAKFSPIREDKSRYLTCHVSSISDSFDPTAGIRLPRKLSYRSLVRPIVQSLASRRIRSDRATHALRIRHEAVSNSDLETAKGVFQGMLARGMHPNEYHFSALMEGYAQSGDLAAANSIMQSAVRAGVPANVVMFTILISGHARQGNPEFAMRVFQDMVTAGVKPDPPAIDAIASAYFFVGAYKMARQVLRDLWPYVQPSFPPELKDASLKDIARALRELHNKDSPPHHMTKKQRIMLRRDLKRLVLTWRSMRSHWRNTGRVGLKK